MNKKNLEREILNEALDKFRKDTGVPVNIVEPLSRTFDEKYYHDAILRIKWNDLDYYFAVEVKNIITRATLGTIIQTLQYFQPKGLVVARYINPRIADELKKMDIPFLDTAGNAYINEPPLHIFIKGNKPPVRYHLEKTTRTFRPAGLQVIFALLCNPGLENMPYRKIAKKADVALGTVDWVMHDLRSEDYLIEKAPRKRQLIRKDDLLSRWVLAYPEKLRPKKIIGRYRADDWDWWKNRNLKDINAFWGGEVAAFLLTKYLKPQNITIYTKPPFGRFLLENRLKQDVNGNIEILNAFWEFETKKLHGELVHPILIYADLLASGDARNIETARIIYDRKLSRFIRED